ncbi:primosome assembly protein PriA [Gordonia sp. HNM0687]|uniref:Probable replication restart protein PriA n=2 Tax=Gordonia mangrovi TaxID=2665643 RepID=A0A6L7GU96_9ACTN|nr:primosomal protein N' [Gordonia mangrovi]MXP22235.1 primosome assembly protein PriA [Gordonia mangrovi]UVF80881.1 primosomal protein N' [Gordonia mangrovi]
MLGLAHLDREFDYLIDEHQDELATPGVRVRVRFSGRLIDGFLLDRVDETEHPGRLGWLERVVSGEPVLDPALTQVCRAVADRYAGTLSDVLRLAVPPRHARTEQEDPPGVGSPVATIPDLTAWHSYTASASFIDLLAAGHPRAVWQATAGEDWPARLAELAAVTASAGRGSLIVVPDQRDLDRLEQACTPLFGDRCVTLAAGLGPTARYRRWLAVRRGAADVVLGTRSAIFAPVHDLGLIVVWDDGDDSLNEPRAPYPHPREVAVIRSHQQRSALVIGGVARTTEAQSLVAAGWAHDLLADRPTVRSRTARVLALSAEDRRVAGDPLARSARIPGVAFDAARRAVAADRPVLFSVPRRGYIPSLACARCRAHARCRVCHGPLQLDAREQISCRWCGRGEPAFRCAECGGTEVRALTTGAGRTAEELGRAFAGVPITTSGGSSVTASVPDGARIVVATPGAEPDADHGYGAAILLDTWAQLDRADLRAAEDAVRHWMSVGSMVRPHTDGGTLVIVADAGLSPVQAVIRWDPVGFADEELRQRNELGFPPAVTMASVDGTRATVSAFVDAVALPPTGELLGPVPLPAGVRPPAGSGDTFDGAVERILLRVPRRNGRQLSAALTAAQIHRNTQHETGPIRVQVDPPTIG